MKRVVAIGLIVAGFAFPALCQRGSGHGGFAGHGGSGFHGGGSAFHSGFSAPSFGGRTAGPRFAPGYGRWGTGRRGYPGRFRGPYAPFYGTVLPYGYAPWGGWPDYGAPDDFGYGDDTEGQDSPPPATQYEPYGPYDEPAPNAPPYAGPGAYGPPGPPAPNAYGSYPPPDAETPPPDRSAPRRPYRPSAQPPAVAAAPETQEPLTLIFKDGRPAQQVHNYILTRSWIYIQDENRRAIPVDQLDLEATAQVNRQAGVDFRLPALSQ